MTPRYSDMSETEADSSFNFFTSAVVEAAAKNAVADVATRRSEAEEAQIATGNVDAAPVLAQPVTAVSAPALSGPASGEPYKPLVLVVEDNADLREFIAASLEPRLRVATAKDGL
jgi:hypothetical protein